MDYFIENTVDPNAVVGIDFQLNLVTRNDGAVLSGMVERETETSLTIRTATDAITVAKDQIRERQVLAQSLMPAGLLDSLPEREVIELLMFLSEPR